MNVSRQKAHTLLMTNKNSKEKKLTSSRRHLTDLFQHFVFQYEDQIHFQHLHTTLEWKCLFQGLVVIDSQERWHHAISLLHSTTKSGNLEVDVGYIHVYQYSLKD